MPETLKSVLRKPVKIISYNSLNYDVSPEQNIIEKTNKDAQNKLTDSNIQDAIKYIKTLSTTGQLNDNTLYSYTRHCRSKTKIFLERFIKLYKYVDLDSLLHQLWEIRTSNSALLFALKSFTFMEPTLVTIQTSLKLLACILDIRTGRG